MRIATNVIRIIVGLLFIVSGLVKANDPSGLGYKMEEFFEVWNSSLADGHFFLKGTLIGLFNFLHQYALELAIAMILLEIVAGVALLVGWSRRFIVTLLLILIVFFTFLTGYAYASGKFKNCGCFGDCLPITPFASFIKDIVLLIMILWLARYQRYIKPAGTSSFRISIVAGSFLLCLLLQWYVLNYLPLRDCLPFKKGNNITQQMKPPANAIQDSFAIRFVYQKGGKQFEFSPTDLPADLDQYTFVSRTDKLIRKGNAEAPIKAFSLIGLNNEDRTPELLQSSGNTIWYFINPDRKSLAIWKQDQSFLQKAKQKNIPVYIITSDADNVVRNMPGFDVLKCDVTVFRTAARTNPTILFVNQGTIVNKWSGRNAASATDALANFGNASSGIY